MENINGIVANRVKAPTITNKEHPISAPIIKIKDKVLPKPIGSEKVADNSENDVNLATPCVNIVIPTSTRNISKPKLKNFRFGTTIDEITFFITTFLKI